jgi:hypothetical protein
LGIDKQGQVRYIGAQFESIAFLIIFKKGWSRLEKDEAMEGRRLHERYHLSQKVTYELSAPLTLKEPRSEEAEGDAQNVSEGGLCLITNRFLEQSQIIKIKLPIPDVVATTPTLAEVRWVKRDPTGGIEEAVQQVSAGQDGSHFLIGLRFLF